MILKGVIFVSSFGFVRVASASPKLKVANPEYNIREIERLVREADIKEAALVVFPELSVTGYTCGDLFAQRTLLNRAAECLSQLLKNTDGTCVVALVGMPVRIKQMLFNCAVAFQNGSVLGVVPKMFLPNYKEFYEKRWFVPGLGISKSIDEIDLLGSKVPFGNLIFNSEELDFSFGVEICEDLWIPVPPSSYMALNGATVIANLSASNDLVSKADYRKQLVAQQSARCVCGYVYSSAGVHESTTDVVFGGDCLIAENGSIIKTSKRFERQSTIIYSEIDVERLSTERQVFKGFLDNSECNSFASRYRVVDVFYGRKFDLEKGYFERFVPSMPFVPDNPLEVNERCAEIFNIQVSGLAKRLEHARIERAVIGISGGLDSTLALLVTAKTFNLLGLPAKNVTAVTMPGFGTTDRTYINALRLMESLGVSSREIDIRPACLLHFSDIHHDASVYDTTYENVQARERTQILMDMANKINGLVVGTGDLSELALGWSTYNGDHMSMYAVNCGIPKTLVKYLVKWVADNEAGEKSKETLYEVLDTPISPELLPPDPSGGIGQKTEDIVGPYELHDFFLYYMVRHGAPPKKIVFLAERAFKEKYPKQEIVKWLRVFYKRFFSQQFKRSCLPDGPKVGTISLSPRGDWRMPSDADASIWLSEI